jgi:hypothetical protein
MIFRSHHRNAGSTHDSCMLQQSSLYQLAKMERLSLDGVNVKGFSPYILGNVGYPLKQWLMTLYRDAVGTRECYPALNFGMPL